MVRRSSDDCRRLVPARHAACSQSRPVRHGTPRAGPLSLRAARLRRPSVTTRGTALPPLREQSSPRSARSPSACHSAGATFTLQSQAAPARLNLRPDNQVAPACGESLRSACQIIAIIRHGRLSPGVQIGGRPTARPSPASFPHSTRHNVHYVTSPQAVARSSCTRQASRPPTTSRPRQLRSSPPPLRTPSADVAPQGAQRARAKAAKIGRCPPGPNSRCSRYLWRYFSPS